MTHRHQRAAAAKLVARLPELPRPWDVEALCRALAEMRGRPLTLHPMDLPAMPFGLWFDDGTGDRIVYRSSATGYYRDHIVLHEICHMLAGHGALPEHGAIQADPAGGAQEPVSGKPCSNAEEELAETFSTMVLKTAGQLRPKKVSAVERRAEELLGAGFA
ncbi:hypothetical protein BLA24_32440 [Streptomyces cinnamoneus]|uniref:Toxin n=1 Tax=Streptomyces cinnamoneus TaxID=53446 RepID=A0A2G1XA83_STRCJ|nr:hypothetical protein [Streptomyces cinnamoneus]PHQ48140.1 hypothetical protein BLA24_32440 [Streptomyces cinnamoneus]PPT15766.1 hypothetical protein CYQ11_25490 [Streptomyces cinnamoneus]